MKKIHGITIKKALVWSGLYFCVMLLYTAVDIIFWQKLNNSYSNWLNIGTIIVLSAVFIWQLSVRNDFLLHNVNHITWLGVLMAIGCSLLFLLLLDNCLDPILENIFPASEEAYKQSITSLANAPITAFIQVCLLAPVLEEFLMRGFVLQGLRNNYGKVVALLVSSAIFALLHFNMVQTLSAFACGLILGLLYLKTKSLFCCILAHCCYNTISFLTVILPLT